MAEAALSKTETALENQRIGGLQLRVAALCLLVQTCDGYDLNSVAWAVPPLIHQWHLPPSMFTTAFLWSSIGIMAGALSAGPIGDRFGRRPLLLASLTIFGIASLLSATADTLGMLTLWRFITGIGIGGGFAGAAALTGDYAPHRLRATMIMATFTGAPLGGFLGGQIVAPLLPHFGWPMIFILGGAFPLVLVVALALWLPESPRFLAARKALSPRHANLLRRLDIAPTGGARVDIASINPIRVLFGNGYALQTVLLWIVFFCSLLNLFLFAYWMPTVLTMIGMTPSQAVFASSLRDFGALFAVLYLGLAVDRLGPERALALHYAAGAVFIAAIALLALPYALLLAMTFLAGMTITGSQTGANGACGKLYPARMRTSGVGWALGIGRLGGVAAPVLGGYLLSLGLPPTRIFLSACVFALIAAAATALLAFRGSRVELPAVEEAAPGM
ncbi:MAG TPA: MFS transporter [Acetobacteraceae bacterium]|jgi:AAHS family 4-hydroxybenzoate transporter-like MFS transporter|nr:MFS transporter [Acetobacteraceae bacterium]